MKLATAPLNFTEVAAFKFVPSMRMLDPTGPLDGVKLLIAGADVVVTRNKDPAQMLPTGVTTLM